MSERGFRLSALAGAHVAAASSINRQAARRGVIFAFMSPRDLGGAPMLSFSLLAFSLLALLLLAAAALAGFTWRTARRVEAELPPRGRFIEIDGQKIHYLDFRTGATCRHGQRPVRQPAELRLSGGSPDWRIPRHPARPAGLRLFDPARRRPRQPAGARRFRRQVHRGAGARSPAARRPLDGRRHFARRRARPSLLRQRPSPDRAGDPSRERPARAVQGTGDPVALGAKNRRMDPGDAHVHPQARRGDVRTVLARPRRRGLPERVAAGFSPCGQARFTPPRSTWFPPMPTFPPWSRAIRPSPCPCASSMAKATGFSTRTPTAPSMRREVPGLSLETIPGGHMIPVTHPRKDRRLHPAGGQGNGGGGGFGGVGCFPPWFETLRSLK